MDNCYFISHTIYPSKLVVNIPNFSRSATIFFIIIFILNIVISRFSNYNPVGKYNIINFTLTYPIIEEFVFRGIIQPSLNQLNLSGVFFELFYLPISLSIIITAFLFSICHLQYYKLSESANFLLFAFTGGLSFGILAEMTQSVWPGIILHIAFNFGAFMYSRRVKNVI